jgi:transcriptional regulator with XRE-family HTH domain
MAGVRIEQLIGENVRQAREDAGISQRELGERVALFLGREWFGQAVHAAERGDRRWTAEDIVAVAWAFQRPISWFFRVPDGHRGDEQLESKGGRKALPLAWLSGEQAPRRSAADIAAQIEQLTHELIRATALEEG